MSREELMGYVIVCLSHNDLQMAEFRAFGVISKKVNKIAVLDFKRANMKLVRESVSIVPWESSFAG